MIFPKYQLPWANWTGPAGAALLTRIYLAMVLLMQGVLKFYSPNGAHTGAEFDEKKNAWVNGEPGWSIEGGLQHLKSTVGNLIIDNSHGWMTQPMVDAYCTFLPFALTGLGVLVLVGIFGRLAMFGAGLVFTSLASGLYVIGDNSVPEFILYTILTGLALFFSKHQRLAITKC